MKDAILNFITVTIFVFSLSFTVPVKAQPANQIEIGKRAYENEEYHIAFKILKPLAEEGHSEAQVIIGDMYNIGRGVQQDNAVAIAWYRKAAVQGNPDAIQMLGQGMRLLGESAP